MKKNSVFISLIVLIVFTQILQGDYYDPMMLRWNSFSATVVADYTKEQRNLDTGMVGSLTYGIKKIIFEKLNDVQINNTNPFEKILAMGRIIDEELQRLEKEKKSVSYTGYVNAGIAYLKELEKTLASPPANQLQKETDIFLPR